MQGGINPLRDVVLPLQFPYNSEVENVKITTLLCSNPERL